MGLAFSDSFRYIINIPIDTEKAVRVRCFTVLFLIFSLWVVWIICQFMVKNKEESKALGVKNALLNKAPSRAYLCKLALLSNYTILCLICRR